MSAVKDGLSRIKRLRKSRSINVGKASTPDPTPSIKQTHIRYVLNHPKVEIIKASIREGLKIVEISRWFSEQGWLDTVNEKTFREYLYTYKAYNPKLSEGGEETYIDGVVSAHLPNIDVETELNRLYRLQKLRLNVDVTTERNISKLFSNTHKEMTVAAQILEQIAKIRGQISSGGAHADSGAVSSDDAIDLRTILLDEKERDKMLHMTEEMLSLGVKIHDEGSKKTPEKSKVSTT